MSAAKRKAGTIILKTMAWLGGLSVAGLLVMLNAAAFCQMTTVEGPNRWAPTPFIAIEIIISLVVLGLWLSESD